MQVKTVSCSFAFLSFRLNLPLSALDISADLPELARCPVALISAGVKSILDIGRSVSWTFFIAKLSQPPPNNVEH